MATLSELRNVRIEKLKKLRKMGVNPYTATSTKQVPNKQLTEDFDNAVGKTFTVTGRISAIRKHKGVAFFDLKDASGKIQLYIKESALTNVNYKNSELKFKDLDLLDLGDFAEATGKLTKTKTDEVSLEITKLRILTKSIRPLPNRWDGLKDKETRIRRRYLDTNMNKNVFERYIRRAKFWEAHREFFKRNDFLEMNVPILENVPGGADANPFVTHMDAIDEDFYLRISQELYLKRLIGGGYERVYEIGPRFRNEGYSDEHLPEHIAMEFYWAYKNFEDGINFLIDLIKFVAKEVYDTNKFKIRGHNVDLSKKWEWKNYVDLIKDNYGIDPFDTTVDDVRKILKDLAPDAPKNITLNRGIDRLWKELRKNICGPIIVVNEPKFLSPLSKENPKDERLALRYHPIIAGSEIGNGFAELNDPIDQLNRFKEQQKLRDLGDKEAQFLDIDFVEMLEYGMPPTFGHGHSERIFWFFEDVPAKEGVPFPQLKHEIDETTKKIYNLK